MRSRPFVLFATLCLPSLAFAQSSRLTGYVTAVQSSGAFDLEGNHIHVPPTVEWRTRINESSTKALASAPSAFFVGETLEATGRLDHATHTFTAAQIVLVPASTASIHGTAIIDCIPPAASAQPASERIVRADGFLLRITAKTKLTFAKPLTSISDVSTNQWIEYSGVQQLDGTVTLDDASITPNTVKSSEDKLRTKSEYNPEKVTDADRQGGASKFFKGTDPRRIPPYGDAAMLARVERIGESLIPAFQRALPDNDPTKIHFRFDVIDSTKWRDAVTMPSGVIVVPREVVERMQNDDQLATVIADNIAEALEKDALRFIPTATKVGATNIAGNVAGIFIPGLGIATDIAGNRVEAHVHAMQLQQSGRVSLDLLHDSGYDVDQAPLAWWLLGPKSPKPIAEIPVPPRAATLYTALGTTWHPAEPSAKPTK